MQIQEYVKSRSREELERLVLKFAEYFDDFTIEADIRYYEDDPTCNSEGGCDNSGFYYSTTGESL